RPAVQVDVPDAAALAGENHLVLVLDEVDAARIRVDEQPAVSTPAANDAGLRDDDVGHAFRVGYAGLRPAGGSAAVPAAAAPATAGGHAGQQFGRRHRRAKPVETPRAVRIDTNPIAFEVGTRGGRPLRPWGRHGS